MAGVGTEKQYEKRRAQNARHALRGMGDAPGEIDQQREQQGRQRIDDFRLPDVASRFGKQGERGKHDRKDD